MKILAFLALGLTYLSAMLISTSLYPRSALVPISPGQCFVAQKPQHWTEMFDLTRKLGWNRTPYDKDVHTHLTVVK